MKLIMSYKKKASVCFNSTNDIFTTYSCDEYDRHSIDSTLYLRALQRISDVEWRDLYKELLHYKQYEMIVHNSVYCYK